MASFPREKNVGIDDRVSIVFGGQEARFFEQYSIRSSVLQQPSQFNATASAASGSAPILKRYPPRTKFVLKVGGRAQFSGELDGFDASSTPGGTTITYHGRSIVARFFDDDVDAERSFTNVTYEQLVRAAMAEVGLSDRKLFEDNRAAREIKSGVGVKVVREPTLKPGVIGGTPALAHVIHAKLGETWFHFLQRHLAKAGTFLSDDQDSNVVILTPNKHQVATFHFVRQRGLLRNVVNVEEAHYRNDTTKRFSEVVIYGRSHGRKFGRFKTKGLFRDQEMNDLGFVRRRVFRDANVANSDEAQEYARRKIAEINRASFQLVYTFSGHTAPIDMQGGRGVVIPDTIAHVKDDEFGINEDMYIESVEYTSPPRKTKVTMMRLQDLVFGSDD